MTIRDYIEEASITGGITDGCQAVAMLNAARKLLFPLDDWVGTIEYGCVRANECCFYLPSHIETIRKAWQCNLDIQVVNENWYYLDSNSLTQYCGGDIAIVRTDRSAVLPVAFPTDNQIGFLIQDEEDKGTKVIVRGRNVFGSTITEVLTLESINEPVFGETLIRELISITKQPTIGSIRVLSKCDRCISNIYVLEEYETNIRYWQYRTSSVCDCVVIKGKKKFFPYKETDLDREIDIQNSTALQFASQAIEHMRAKRYAEHADAIKLARTYLERTKEDLKKTNAPGVAAYWEPARPVTNSRYGY